MQSRCKIDFEEGEAISLEEKRVEKSFIVDSFHAPIAFPDSVKTSREVVAYKALTVEEFQRALDDDYKKDILKTLLSVTVAMGTDPGNNFHHNLFV